MSFQPDILITRSHGMLLVAEAKVHLPNLERTEQELKQYMFMTQCPIGLLITPERMWVYRDFYTTRSPESIQRVGEFNVKSLWAQPPPLEPVPFELFVQRWLEDLSREQTGAASQDLREALQDYVLPAIADGEVRAAHPRYF